MFSSWGRLAYRHRRLVLVATTILLLVGGVFGLGLTGQLSQSGYDDPGSESTQAALLSDETFGRDHMSDVIVLYTAPDGLTVDDPAFAAKVEDSLNRIKAEFPDQIGGITSYWTESFGKALLSTKDKRHAFASVQLTGSTDTQTLEQYHDIKGSFALPGIKVEVSGLQPIGDAIGVGTNNDTKRAELIALPAVAVLLFFVFGGVVAALLPVIVGVLTIAGATGALWVLTHFMDVNTFAQPVVTLIGLGLAIDYALFIVSRFREELAEGYDVGAAVRRSVATAGRTVVFSATMLVVAFTGLLMFPQGFLKSVAFGGLFAIAIAAFTSLTVLPALLGLLGRRIDSLSLPFLNKPKTNEQIEAGFWGKLTDWVGKHPGWVATPIVIVMLLLIVPFKNVAFGGLSEKYLPPDNPTRVAQEHFDELFPTFRTNPVDVVITGASDSQVVDIATAANQIDGFTGPFKVDKSADGVTVLSAGLVDPDRPGNTITELREIPEPPGVDVLVGGVPAMTVDTIDALVDMLPWMILFLVVTTTILMFLAFGSLVLPIKAVLMSALGLGSTLGILTWIFIDGNGASLLNFTPGPLMPAVVVLLLAIIFGLSTDYEVFLISRMVEARERGATTREAIRIGTAHTGRIITAAALILIVVTGAFGFSEIVMMKYIAYGMISALILDATVIRMLLVPAVMTMLGDDCWWAPQWMKRIQQRIGLGEIHLPDERPTHIATGVAAAGAGSAAGAARAVPVRVGAGAQHHAGAATTVGAALADTPPDATTVIPRITTEQTPAFAAEQDEAPTVQRPQARPASPAAPPRAEAPQAGAPRTGAPRTEAPRAGARTAGDTGARRPEPRRSAPSAESRTPQADAPDKPPARRPARGPSGSGDTPSRPRKRTARRPAPAQPPSTAPPRTPPAPAAPARTPDSAPAAPPAHRSGAEPPRRSTPEPAVGSDAPRPRYPWEERPTAPRMRAGGGGSGTGTPRERPGAHSAPEDAAQEAESVRHGQDESDEATGGRHLRPDASGQVTVEELLRRHRK
ncbi:MMPL family transporter [Tomitella gaofuii]|uniref:MMPL family transporter n=1 Tax=Tomitella gaofuii TaxID=2760083 RepID=UPI0020BDE56A|nr:MMPL family transporter [Tomitella gaofuii]